jgi:putative DNA primase/helicase
MDNITEIKFQIAVASRKTQKTWKNIEMSWQEFIDKAENPIRTNETMAEYRAMSKEEKGAKKDVGGFVGGYLKDGIRKRGQLKSRQLICLDADNIRGGVDFPAKVMEALEDKFYLYYTTHSHTKE